MSLFHYLNNIGLPNKIIEPRGMISDSFLKREVVTLWDAIEYTYQLPYGRTTNREDYLQISRKKKVLVM